MKPLSKLFSRAGAITLVSLLLLQVTVPSGEAAKAVAPFKPAIVYLSHGNSASYVCLADSSGKVVVLAKTTQFRVYFRNPLWNRDGTQIFFQRVSHDPADDAWPPKVIENRLFMVKSDGTGLTDLGVMPQLEGYEPDLLCRLPGSEKLVLLAGGFFYTFVPGTPAIKQDIGLTGIIARTSDLTFSPDFDEAAGFQGFIIVAGVQLDPYVPGTLNDLWKIPAAEDSEGRFVFGTPTRITDTPDLDEQFPSLSPDGSWVTLSYYSYSSGEYIQAFNLCSVLTGETVLLAPKRSIGSGTWAPDGKHVAFQAVGRTAHTEIFRVRTDGTAGLVSLTPKSADATASEAVWNPAWVNDIDP